MPGAVVYERKGDAIFRKNSCVFGPGDLYCPIWNLLAMGGMGEQGWTPRNTSTGHGPGRWTMVVKT
jgi:hypothetical protein